MPIDSAYFLARSTTGKSSVSRARRALAGRKIFSKRMAHKLRMSQDSPQIRMTFELDAEHVVGFAFGPVGAFPDVDGGVDGWIVAGNRHFQPQPMFIR